MITPISAMVESMDEAFGELVQAVKDAGLYDDTLCIFTSDVRNCCFYVVIARSMVVYSSCAGNMC